MGISCSTIINLQIQAFTSCWQAEWLLVCFIGGMKVMLLEAVSVQWIARSQCAVLK